MPKLINKNAVIDNPWTVIKASTGPEILQVVPGKNFIVPLQLWKLYQEELNEYDGNIAVWLDSDENPEQITGELDSLPLIALNFPIFFLHERTRTKAEVRLQGRGSSYWRRTARSALLYGPMRL
jgi:uncharacterized protein (DUF934 family)